MRQVAFWLGFALLSGCSVIPRSVVYGQTAAALGTGQAEVGASAGVQYAHFTDSNASPADVVQLPAAEANVSYGISDAVGLNLHLSQAGIQPGLKVSLLNGGVQLAVLPEVGVAVATASGGPSGSGGLDFDFIAGAKVLVSIPAGFYGGAGYDFGYYKFTTSTGAGPSGSSETEVTAHSISAAFGWDTAVGSLRIRPELAVVFSPGFNSSSGGASSTGSPQLLFFPNVTFALGSGPVAPKASPSEAL